VSVVSTTDYWVERQIEALGPLDALALKKLAARSLDHELAVRQRRMDELQAASVTVDVAQDVVDIRMPPGQTTEGLDAARLSAGSWRPISTSLRDPPIAEHRLRRSG
jgi:hypothetical protein